LKGNVKLQLIEKNYFIRIVGEKVNFHATFNSGQCFRWSEVNNNTYVGVVNQKPVIIEAHNDFFDLYNVSVDEFKKYFYWYFDFDKDYIEIENFLSEHDEVLSEAVSKYSGMRILNQEPFECIISFIISQNNNIKRIKMLIDRLCQHYGRKIDFMGNTFYSFPEPEELINITEDELIKLGFGYRAKYILSAVDNILNKKINLGEIYDIPYEQAKKELKKIKGIGDKVADCILLYSFNKYNAFPLDVWTKRVLKEVYNFQTTKQIYNFINSLGEYAGYAQLFLFHYIRNSNK